MSSANRSISYPNYHLKECWTIVQQNYRVVWVSRQTSTKRDILSDALRERVHKFPQFTTQKQMIKPESGKSSVTHQADKEQYILPPLSHSMDSLKTREIENKNNWIDKIPTRGKSLMPIDQTHESM